MSKKVFWCKRCLNMSTRPRIEFDDEQVCNACHWVEEKKTMDWEPRQKQLSALLEKHRSFNPNGFNCIVPVSGGKDGSYVSYMLKHQYGMNPLTVTVRPALPLALGEKNVNRFIESGFDHIQISPNSRVMQKLNKIGFVDKGFPYLGWLIAVKTAVMKIAVNFNIPLVFYGEDGDIEYGGSTETKHEPIYNMEYMKRIYFEGGYDKALAALQDDPEVRASDLSFWHFPSEEEFSEHDISFTHWGYFESWDSYRNYVVAKEHCGLIEKESGSSGTFTNFAQNDQALYSLHTYLMYLKFGFGRATQDAGIEIRRGAMTRQQALNLVKAFDNQYPEEFIDMYLEYYEMTKDEFDKVLDKYANKDLFEKQNGIWQPKFVVGEAFEI